MLSTHIKESTKTPHQEVEKKVVLRIKAIRSEADYIDLLKHFYAYFNAVEQAIAPYITTAILPDLDNRRNSSYIKADIEELGGNINELPAAVAPNISNAVQALGALYVLEGSIMGGPYIVQMLQKGGISKGFSFFNGYGAESGQKWAGFISVLNSLPQNEEESSACLKAAEETFANFGDVFENATV